MPKIKRKQIVILILAILILYVVTEAIPGFVSKATPTTTIEYGNLLVEDDVTCYACEMNRICSSFGRKCKIQH